MPFVVFLVILVLASIGVLFWIVMFALAGDEEMKQSAIKKIIQNNALIAELENKDQINTLKLSRMSGAERVFMSLFLTVDSSKEINRRKEENKRIQNGKLSSVNIFVLPGYSVMRIFGLFENGRIYKTLFMNNAELFGRKNAEKNTKYMLAAMASYSLIGISLVILAGLLVSTVNLTIGAIVGGVGVLLVSVFVYAMYDDVASKVAKRKREIVREFPSVVSKLALLMSSGMIMARTWVETANSGFSALYTEMKATSNDLENNISPEEAYGGFITRCNTKETSKLASAILQNLSKGNAEIAEHLRNLSRESWQERKHYAKREAEKANAKLIVPTMLLFVTIMIIIMVPIAMNFSGGSFGF